VQDVTNPAVEIGIADARQKEMWNGVSLIGPQRDDLRVALRGRDVATHASRGQQRTIIVALKLAERDLLGHYIPWLATIGSVSPLLGLLGTTVGIINAFTGIATKGSGNLAAVAPGVAEALVATFAGLAAAIPAVITYNLYVNRTRLFAGELEGFANELVGTMAREGLI